MAKRKKKYKQSAYTRYRNNIMRQVRSLVKKGVQINVHPIPTELQLRKQGIKGSELAKKAKELGKKLNFLKAENKTSITRGVFVFLASYQECISILTANYSHDPQFIRRKRWVAEMSRQRMDFLANYLKTVKDEVEQNEIGKNIETNMANYEIAMGQLIYGSEGGVVQQGYSLLLQLFKGNFDYNDYLLAGEMEDMDDYAY